MYLCKEISVDLREIQFIQANSPHDGDNIEMLLVVVFKGSLRYYTVYVYYLI